MQTDTTESTDGIDPNLLTHLVGYTSLSLILATASWANPIVLVFVAPLALVTGYLVARHAIDKTLAYARRRYVRETALETAEVSPDD